jgi:hypothetical protein
MKTITAALLALVLITGCATVQPGSQNAEVQAERTLVISLASIDSFLRFESAHRSELPPSVAAIARAVRQDAPKALSSANTTRMAYKSNRSGGEASLWTALAVVESLVGQVRVWLPTTTASGSGERRRHTLELEAEARGHDAKTTGSFVLLVPLFVDLAKEVFKAVNESRAAAAQNAEWSAEQDAAFAAKLTATMALPHWKP